MPPLPIITDTFRCALKWTGPFGLHAVSVIHVYGPGFDQAGIFAQLDGAVDQPMWNAVNVDTACVEVDVTPLDGLGATVSFLTGAPTKWQGHAAGDPVPAVACVVKHSTGLRGREYRGRTFLPFVGEDVQTAGTLDPTTVAVAQGDWTRFLADFQAEGANLTVASYKLQLQTIVLNSTVEIACGTQRRRQERVRA